MPPLISGALPTATHEEPRHDTASSSPAPDGNEAGAQADPPSAVVIASPVAEVSASPSATQSEAEEHDTPESELTCWGELGATDAREDS